MSHYAVAVFNEQDGYRTYEDLLKPYDEKLSFPHYISKEEIIAKVRKEIENYKNTIYAEYLKDPESYIEKCDNENHIKYVTTEFPQKLNWTDEECYAEGVRFYEEENIKPDGSVFELYNSNAKWDWYQVGGRFSNCVPLIDGGFDDEADMINVDIDYHNEEQYRKAIRFWQLYIDGETPVTEEDENLIKYTFYTKKHYIERYKDAEDYADECSGFTFYAALLPNGEWIEPGKMGWFGISFATADDDIKWRDTQKEILKKAKESNWHITMVDCHI